MAKKIDQPFIRVHENMPEHPKVIPLTDKAFRVLVDTWCWCKRAKTNGHVTAAVWKRRPAKVRTELLAAGLVEDDFAGGVIVHDFDDWQMTTDEMDEVKEQASTDGKRAAHERWHVIQGKPSDDCSFCQAAANGMRGA